MPGSTLTEEGGWSLLGVMIGAAVGLLVLAGASQIYVQSYRDSVAVIEKTDLNQELRYLIQFMADDIRRAGSRFWEPSGGSYRDNLFWNSDYDLDLSVHEPGSHHDCNPDCDYDYRKEGSCILFAYDLNGDGELGVLDVDKDATDISVDKKNDENRERFGFRLGDEGSVKARTGGGDPFNCSGDSWESISDPRINIGDLGFTLYTNEINLSDSDKGTCEDGDLCVKRRWVEITLEGSPEDASWAGHTMETTVTVRNDKVFEKE